MADVASRGLIFRVGLPAAAVVVVMVAALALIASLRGASAAGELVLTEVSGSVQIVDADGPVDAQPGLRLGAGEEIRTAPGSSAVVSTASETQIRIESGTRVRIQAIDDDMVSLELEGGRLRAEVRAGGRPVRIASGDRAVLTEDGDVAVAVDAEGALAIQVDRGSSAVTGVQGMQTVTAGMRVVSMPNGVSASGDIPEDLLLDVAWPEERRTRRARATISGTTQPLARVRVHGAASPVELRADALGRFEGQVELLEGEHAIGVTVVDAFGAQVEDEVRMELDTTAPRLSGGLGPGP